jgi:hypothetical protein
MQESEGQEGKIEEKKARNEGDANKLPLIGKNQGVRPSG